MANRRDGLIVSVSGIRGVVGRSLLPEDACGFARALGSALDGGRVVVGRDPRPSGDLFRHAVISGLMAAGCSVEDIGIVPTPTCGLAVKHLTAAGGIMITASHNPAPWNGLKMFGPDGAVLPGPRGKMVAELFESGHFDGKPWDGLGRYSAPPDVTGEHLRRVTDLLPVGQISARRFRVVLDGNGGAGGPLACELLEQIGCEVVRHACEADGEFVHEPEPTPANLEHVAPIVPNTESAAGFCLDPDSDRLALIDEKGNCVSEELTLALAVKHRLRHDRGPVAINFSTSRVVEDICKEYRVECIRTPVGEANVVRGMRALQAVIGGEGNGGVIDPRVGWVRDPFIGMGLILAELAETGQTLSQALAELPQYSMVKIKVEVAADALATALQKIEAEFAGARVDRADGLRLEWDDAWLQVRASNTEPVVRIIAESPTEGRTRELCDRAKALLQ